MKRLLSAILAVVPFLGHSQSLDLFDDRVFSGTDSVLSLFDDGIYQAAVAAAAGGDPNLYLYWNFEAGSLSPIDISGNGRTGVDGGAGTKVHVTNSATISAYWNVTVANQFVGFSHSNATHIGDTLTMSFWAKKDHTTTMAVQEGL